MTSDLKPKLLVVEDDPGLQAQLKWAYPDFEVIVVGDRASAIAALRAEGAGEHGGRARDRVSRVIAETSQARHRSHDQR